MLALTVSLGVWQVHRLAWKTDLLASIDRGEAAPPTPLPPNPAPFTKVTVTGRFRPDFVRYGSEVRADANGAIIGAHIVGVLDRPDGPPVVVDLGWAPDTWSGPLPDGPTAVEGYIRPPEQTPLFGTADDPARRRFFALDALGIGAALGALHAEPFTVQALGPPSGIPEPIQALPRPPNDHLNYAITWFALSAALVTVFGVFVRQTIQQQD